MERASEEEDDDDDGRILTVAMSGGTGSRYLLPCLDARAVRDMERAEVGEVIEMEFSWIARVSRRWKSSVKEYVWLMVLWCGEVQYALFSIDPHLSLPPSSQQSDWRIDVLVLPAAQIDLKVQNFKTPGPTLLHTSRETHGP